MKYRWSACLSLVAVAAAVLPLAGGLPPGLSTVLASTSVSTRVTAGVTASFFAVPNPALVADMLVRAWGSGDRPTVNGLATAGVSAALFAFSSPGGVSWRRTGSEGTAGTVFVTYHDDVRGGTVTVGVSDVVLAQGQAHAVYRVLFSQAYPIDAAGYADRLVVAWGRGDRAGAGVYATAATVSTLFGHANPGGRFWARTSASGAAGTEFVTYHDNTGQQLVVRVNIFAAQDAQRHAAYEADFTR